jgi:hypothetical protein
MPRYGLQVLKRTTYRGGVQHFANTYHYESAIVSNDLAGLEALLDAIVALEKTIFATDVTFIQGRVWSTALGQANNQMLVDKPLSGAGVRVTQTTLDRERAVLIQFRAGVDTRGRPVYLRKWYHICGAAISGNWPNDVMQQIAQISSTFRSDYVAFGNSIKSVTAGGATNLLVAQSGRTITGATSCHPYLEHRQLGDEWRGN